MFHTPYVACDAAKPTALRQFFSTVRRNLVLARHAAETIKDRHRDQERTALIAFLRTKPKTSAGCLAALRYLTDYTENNGGGIFGSAAGELTLAGASYR